MARSSRIEYGDGISTVTGGSYYGGGRRDYGGGTGLSSRRTGYCDPGGEGCRGRRKIVVLFLVVVLIVVLVVFLGLDSRGGGRNDRGCDLTGELG